MTNPTDRSADDTFTELQAATAAVDLAIARLARCFGGCTVIAGFDRGKSTGALMIAASGDGPLCSPLALDRAKALAKIVGNLPAEQLRFMFAHELAANHPVDDRLQIEVACLVDATGMKLN